MNKNDEHIIRNESFILVQKLKKLGIELGKNAPEKISKIILKLKS